MSHPRRVVVIGATGHFGGRACRRLVRDQNIDLVVSSRNLRNAAKLVSELQELSSGATVSAVELDQSSSDFTAKLRSIEADIVLHTAGPYQDQSYRVARACIDCGSHYVDLADGRAFVQNFASLHDDAKEKGVLLISGASTLPGLSSAVIDHLQNRFATVQTIEMSIAPGHQTPRGTGTVVAVLSYCGKPFKVLVNNSWSTMYGWQALKTQRYPKLGLRWSGACDVPDLALLPEYVPDAHTVTFHAALEAKWEQLALWLMAWLTRLRLVSDWSRFTPTFRWLSDRSIRLGSDTGGMHIRLTGKGLDQKHKIIDWFLTARHNHGPEIPCSPALILVRKLAADEIPIRGAFPCLGMFTLPEFDKEVAELDIDWEINETN